MINPPLQVFCVTVRDTEYDGMSGFDYWEVSLLPNGPYYATLELAQEAVHDEITEGVSNFTDDEQEAIDYLNKADVLEWVGAAEGGIETNAPDGMTYRITAVPVRHV